MLASKADALEVGEDPLLVGKDADQELFLELLRRTRKVGWGSSGQ